MRQAHPPWQAILSPTFSGKDTLPALPSIARPYSPAGSAAWASTTAGEAAVATRFTLTPGLAESLHIPTSGRNYQWRRVTIHSYRLDTTRIRARTRYGLRARHAVRAHGLVPGRAVRLRMPAVPHRNAAGGASGLRILFCPFHPHVAVVVSQLLRGMTLFTVQNL